MSVEPDAAAHLAALVDEVADLASPPDIVIRVFELLDAPESTAREIGEVISQDPSLTAKLLRLVNSPYFGLRARIDTVSRAVAVLGMHELYGLILAVSAMKSFHRLNPDQGFDIERFWRHNISAALLARGLARRCRVLQPERLFVAGLLHDIGVLVFANRCADDYARVVDAAVDEDALRLGELERFGFDHAELGASLLRRWSLPEHLIEAVRLHHQPAPDLAGAAGLDAALVYLANALADGLPEAALRPAGQRDEAAWRALPWARLAGNVPAALESAIPDLLAEVEGEFSEMAALLMPR